MPKFSDTLDQAKDAAVEVEAKREQRDAAKRAYEQAMSEATAYYQAALAKAKERYDAAQQEAKHDLDAATNDAKLAWEEASRQFTAAMATLQTLRAEIADVLGDVLEPPNPRVRIAS